MSQLIAVVWDLLRLRRGPDALPAAGAFLGFSIALYALLTLATMIPLASEEVSFLLVVTLVVVTLALASAVLWMLLLVRGVPARLNQTLSAWLLADAALTLPAVPLILAFPESWAALLDGRPEEATPALQAGLLVLAVWELLVQGHILHRALDVGRVVGVMLALLTTMVVTTLGQALVA
jgi:hypothetical protein